MWNVALANSWNKISLLYFISLHVHFLFHIFYNMVLIEVNNNNRHSKACLKWWEAVVPVVSSWIFSDECGVGQRWIGLSNPIILSFVPHCKEGFTPQPHINSVRFCVAVRRRCVSEIIPAEVPIFKGHMGAQIFRSAIYISVRWKQTWVLSSQNRLQTKQQGTKSLHCFTSVSKDSMGHVTTVAIGNITSVARGAETDAETSADGILPFVSVWDGGLLEVSEECSLETRRDSFQERQTPDDPCGRDWRRNAVQQRMLQITAFILLKCDCECQQFFIYN